MTPSKSRFQSFELDFAKSSHVLLAWWWLRSHRFYFQFLGGMIHFSCTSFAKCVVQPSTFRFEVGAREEAFCICNRADDRSWILTRICRWCWTYWWRNCSCLRSDGSGIFLGALSWIYFLLNDFFAGWKFRKNLEVKKKKESKYSIAVKPACWPKLSYPNLAASVFRRWRLYIFPKMKLFLHAAHLSKSKTNNFPEIHFFTYQDFGRCTMELYRLGWPRRCKQEADKFFEMNSYTR